MIGNRKEEKKRGLFDTGILAVKILLYAMLIITAFVFIYFGLINRGDVLKEDPLQYVRDWTILDDENGTQTIRSTIPQNIRDNEYLFFDIRKDVSIYINGELRKDFIEERDVNIPGGSFKRFMISVPLQTEDAGAEVVIVRKNLQDIDQDVPEVFISTRFGALDHRMKKGGLSFILAIIILIFSFVAFVVSVVLRIFYKEKIDMLYGALGILVIASWLITDSYLFPFLFGVYHVNGLLNYLFCLMIPLPLTVFLSSIQCGRYRRSMFLVLVLAILNAVVWPVLHFTGILPFAYVRDIANAMLVVLTAAGIVVLIVDAIRGNAVSYRYTFIGFLGFLLGCLVELAGILFDLSAIPESISMVVGLGFLLTFIVIQQVDDLRKINMEKQHAIDISEAKTKFLASMSHEIRTPINAILGMNEMILRENNDQAIEEYARNIKTSGKMLLMLVNDVLDFTKIEAGKLEIREMDFQASEMLYDVVSLIRERAEEKDLALVTEITAEVPDEMISDEFRIKQVLVNLMNNAVKYTEKGTVTLLVGGSYTDEGYLLSLRVRDTGKGIRKEDQEHLFEAFSRADMKANANIEGTGLGLAIVKSIVDSMEGELGVDSEYGVGSEFWVKLPVKYKSRELLRDDFMERKAAKTASVSGGSFTALDAKILAVDDNQSNLTIVKLFLKRNGIVPDLCTTGTRAVELCREKKYDLILMDHMMPQPDGIETLHRIREDEASLNRETKTVVLTANAVAGSRQMYIREGFEDYLTKPLDSGLLEETVKRLLPAEKVKEMPSASAASSSETAGSLRKRLTAIKGLDYDTALLHCAGDETFLQEIMSDIAGEGEERAERMRRCLKAEDLKSYEIDAHTIKSNMATLGLQAFSDRAKKHEFAAKDQDMAFIQGDAEDFLDRYTEICTKLLNC